MNGYVPREGKGRGDMSDIRWIREQEQKQEKHEQ